MLTRFRSACILLAATAGLGGCVGMDPYGYGASVGYGGGYSPYGYGGYGGYGDPYGAYGYGSPYYGWYDDYYYPGTGYYVYSRSGSRHRWSDSQRRYWENHRGDRQGRENWSGYRRPSDAINAWANSGNVNGGSSTQQVRTVRRERNWSGSRGDSGMSRVQPSDNGVTRVERREWRRDSENSVRPSRVERRQSSSSSSSDNGVTRIRHYKRSKDD